MSVTDRDRQRAADALGSLDDIGDTAEQQIERIAETIAAARQEAQIEQLLDAARVLTDRADVLKRGLR